MGNTPHRIVGADNAEGPPVPIPNTEVKLSGAEDTWLVTARENRKTPTPIFLLSSVGRATYMVTYRKELREFPQKG